MLPPERMDPNEDLKTCGTKHVAYQVNDLEAYVSNLRNMNADIALEPFNMNEKKVCFIRDNNGILIELIQL